MRYLFKDVPEACDNTLWIAERADVSIDFGDALLPNFPLPEGFTDDSSYLAHITWQGARERWGDDIPEATRARIQYELDTISTMGFSSYFLIVWDLIKHARDGGIRVGPGTRLGRRVRRCLRAQDHRSRPDPLRPAVRALPEPEPHLDARHRHGLRLPLPGRDDPLRGRALRPRPRRPDHHVRHDQGPQRGARRGPRPRVPVQRRRPHRQGHAAARHGPRHAAQVLLRAAPQVRRRLQGGVRAAGDVRHRHRRQEGRRRRQGPRGPEALRRHPRRRRRHHQGAAHRVPARAAQAGVRPAARALTRRHAVRDARRRGARPAEDGLPRPAQPRRHQRHRGHAARRRRRRTSTSTPSPSTTPRRSSCCSAARASACSSSRVGPCAA